MSTPSNHPRLEKREYLSWLEISLTAIRSNYRLLKSQLPETTRFLPVIKADAYGHGATEVYQALEEEGATQVCVARLEEAVALRQAGARSKILVFAPPLGDQALLAAKYDLEVVVCDPAHLDAVVAAQSATGKAINIHVKIDIGMGRMGLPPADLTAFLQLCDSKHLTLCGIMSHFPCADADDPALTLTQVNQFEAIQKQILATGRTGLLFHTANSAATMRFPSSWFDAVRVGIALYGQNPDYKMKHNFPLSPAMSLYTTIVYIKEVPAGTPISYCQLYHTPAPARLATLALGYADGYPRHATQKTNFLLHGKLAPQVGRICMDQLVIDVTDIPRAAIGDTVLAFGISPEGALHAEEVAYQFDTIGYELTTRIGKRLPRFYR